MGNFDVTYYLKYHYSWMTQNLGSSMHYINRFDKIYQVEFAEKPLGKFPSNNSCNLAMGFLSKENLVPLRCKSVPNLI